MQLGEASVAFVGNFICGTTVSQFFRGSPEPWSNARSQV
ncbi:hypothetical protein SZ55_3579 [Pseudomonas sp. FeS53a]|nr:hypothetical protein SZ55_3579 [Pseudomonas sp. FeS53a]